MSNYKEADKEIDSKNKGAQSFQKNNNEIQESSGSSDFGPNAIALNGIKNSADESLPINNLAQLEAKANVSDKTTKINHIQTLADHHGTDLMQLQSIADGFSEQMYDPIQRKENNTGLPDNLKSGIENLSGQDLSDVKVHYNSDKPAQLNAHAYAQGTDIHVASGQENHIAHEAWHVVQQKQNRVAPTTEVGGQKVNDDKNLEKEADLMGGKAMVMEPVQSKSTQLKKVDVASSSVKQGVFQRDVKEAAPVEEAALVEEAAPEASKNEPTVIDKVKENAPLALAELGKFQADGELVSKNAQLLEDPTKDTLTASDAALGGIRKTADKASSGVFSTIKAFAGPIMGIIKGVAAAYGKWNAWGSLKKLGESQSEKGKLDPKIPYTIEKLSKSFLVAVNSTVQSIISFVQRILALVPGFGTAAAAGIAAYKSVYAICAKLYAVPKHWYQVLKGKSNKKDVNSKEVCDKAWKGDDASIDFLWALGLPTIQGSGFESIDNLKNWVEKQKTDAGNAVKGVINDKFGTDLKKEEEPQNIAQIIAQKIKGGGSDGKEVFKELIREKSLNDKSKAKIQSEVKVQMTGIGV